MKIFAALALLLMTSCSRTIYVVRHAEKATVPQNADRMMAADPPLSEIGQQRAQALKQLLENKGIKAIYTTPYKRTMETVAPLATATGAPVLRYSPRPDSTNALIDKITTKQKGNILIAGHSNTVDDIVNRIAGKTEVQGDLADSVYNALFILRIRGNKVAYKRITY